MSEPTASERRVAVAIVGTGPAGLAAAVALRRAGVGPVLLLEREGEAGGVPRHCGHPPFGLREFRRLLTGPAYARRLVGLALALGAEIALRHSVVALEPQGRLQVATPEGPRVIIAERVLLATGVRESSRAQRFIGGDRPLGVVTTGALQAFVYGEGRLPCRAPVILGSELVSFSALLTLRRAGARPVAMIESLRRAVARWPAALYPRLVGLPLLLGHGLREIRGRERVEAVLLEDPDGGERRLDCDGVVLTGRFRPAAELARAAGLTIDPGSQGPAVDQFGRTSDPLVFAAGNLLHPVETAGWCWREGGAVGAAIADDLAEGLPAPAPATPVQAGDGFSYVLPQRLLPGGGAAALGRLQARARESARGEIEARCGDSLLWRRRAVVRPERRLLLDLPASGNPESPIRLSLRRDSG